MTAVAAPRLLVGDTRRRFRQPLPARQCLTCAAWTFGTMPHGLCRRCYNRTRPHSAPRPRICRECGGRCSSTAWRCLPCASAARRGVPNPHRAPRVWTHDRDDALEAGYTAGVPVAVLAAGLGVTVHAVRCRVGVLGLTRGTPPALFTEAGAA